MKLQHCVLAAVVLALQGRSVTGQGQHLDCDAPPTCPGDEVVCNNGVVDGDPTMSCTSACDGQCCVGVGACSGFTGTVCMDGSCDSPFSCRNANIDLVVNSCHGMLSCDAVGGESDAPDFLANSCNGTMACTNAGILGTLQQITDSCSGYSACARIAQNGRVPKIVDSCIGEVACWEVASNEDGNVGGLEGSCQGARACWGAARDDVVSPGIFECCDAAPTYDENNVAVGECEGVGVFEEGEARPLPDDCRRSFPTCAPTTSPTLLTGPSAVASDSPSASDAPSTAPSVASNVAPSLAHSDAPNLAHSAAPSLAHSAAPSLAHSDVPSVAHSDAPSAAHSDAPSIAHSDAPSLAHSDAPSVAHSHVPSDAPSTAPSAAPSVAPSLAHSAAPSVAHSATPSHFRRVIISTNITITTPGPFVPDSAVDCERIVEEQFRLPVETRLMADLDMSANELGVTVTSVDDIAPPCAAFEVTRRALVARALQGPTITTFTYEIRPVAAMTDETAAEVEANLRTDVAASLSLETLQDLLDTEEVEEVFGGKVIVGRVDTGLDGDDPIIETASPTSGAPTPAPSVSAGFCAPIRANGGLECDIGTFVVCATPGASGCGADEECYDKMLCPAFNQGNEDMFGQCELSPGGGGTACEDHTTYCTDAGMSSECGTARMCYDATLCDSVAPTYSPTAFPTLPVVPPPPAPPTAPTPPGPDSPGICAPPIVAGGLECMPKPTPDWAYCTAPGGQAECDSGHTCYNKLLCPEFNSDSFNAGGYEAVCELSAGAGPECTAFTTYCEVPGSECGNGRVCHDALLCNAGQPGICAPAPNDNGLECSLKPDPDWAYCSTPNSRSQCHSLGASYTCYPKRLCPEFVPDGNSGYPGVCGLYFQSNLRGLDCPQVTTMCAEVGSESNCASGGLCFDATLCNNRIGSHAGFCAVPVMAGGGRVLHDNGYDCDLLFSPASRTTWCDEPGEGGQCPVGEVCLDAEMCTHTSNPKSGKSKTKSSRTKTGKGSKSAKGTSKSKKSSKGAKRV